ncbi:hypothetical protein CK203_111027 [Vitis vinifera]|uniref:RNase H type-1 domain-containing protein n=1 Tax=Vitis vinifera TaxID=29760 RepID=A0A438CQT5_VITVI|nr:hypothetical protein CK203_111027 [Vitis vinifera]
MKLNPSKCAFGVSAGNSGIYGQPKRHRSQPGSSQAVMETPPPRNKKELQRLTGKLVAPIPKEKLYMYLLSQNGQSAPFYSAALHQRTETCLLCQQGIGRCRNQHSAQTRFNWANATMGHRIERIWNRIPTQIIKKGQVMADFVLEYSRRPNQHHESSEQEWWTLRVDGASRSSGSGVGLLLQSPTGEHLEQAIRLGFSASNNEAEYKAILSGLDLALALSVSKLRIYSDSQLVLPPSLSKKPFYCHTCASHPSVTEDSTCNTIEANQTDDQEWTHNIAEYLRADTLPEDPKQAHKIRVQAARFTLIGGHLYKRSSQGLIFAVLGIQKPMGHGHSGTLPAAPAQKKFLLSPLITSVNGEVGGGATRRPVGLSNHTRTPTGNTPFALTYGMDAVIPTEIGLPTIRTDAAKQKDANTELGRNLDWADEVRESASIRMADYQQRASAHYNRKVRPRNFKNGTLVLRKVFENTAEVGAGKFQANWEGPYIVSKANENGAYHLQKLDGTPLLRPWNVSNLKQYYQ